MHRARIRRERLHGRRVDAMRFNDALTSNNMRVRPASESLKESCVARRRLVCFAHTIEGLLFARGVIEAEITAQIMNLRAWLADYAPELVVVDGARSFQRISSISAHAAVFAWAPRRIQSAIGKTPKGPLTGRHRKSPNGAPASLHARRNRRRDCPIECTVDHGVHADHRSAIRLARGSHQYVPDFHQLCGTAITAARAGSLRFGEALGRIPRHARASRDCSCLAPAASPTIRRSRGIGNGAPPEVRERLIAGGDVVRPRRVSRASSSGSSTAAERQASRREQAIGRR